MEITLVWSWWSFFAGVAATIVAGFWLLVGLAFRQWNKNRKKNKETDDLYASLFKKD